MSRRVGTPLRAAAAGLAILALAGCAAPLGGPTVPSAKPEAAVRATPEQGGRFIAFTGPRRQHDEPFLGVPGTNFYVLRSWLDTRTGDVAHQLYVSDSYFGAERNWDRARAGNGAELRVIPISKNEISCENGCSYAEEFAAALPNALLRASPQGLSITFAGRAGAAKTIAVPGELVTDQLRAVDAARASLRTAAMAAPLPAR